MNIEIKEFQENEDGSADVDLELDKEAKEFLIQEGFMTVLKAAIDSYKPKETTDG